MSIRITHIRLSGGSGHEHISRLWWTNTVDAKSDNSTRAQLVSWIDNDNGVAYVEDTQRHQVRVGVVKPTYGDKYLRTYADRVWTNNLLALPHK